MGIKSRKRSKTPHDPSTPTILTYDQWETFDVNNGNGSTTHSQRYSLQNMYAANSINRSRSSNLTLSPNIISEDLNSDNMATLKQSKTFHGRSSDSSSRKYMKRHSDFSLSKQNKAKSVHVEKRRRRSQRTSSRKRTSAKNKLKRSASVTNTK